MVKTHTKNHHNHPAKHSIVPYQQHWHRFPFSGRYILAILGVALIGYAMVRMSHAATNATTAQAEDGQLTGNYSLTSRADGAGGTASAVSFGTGIVVPAASNLEALTGGNSIALLWDLPDGIVKTEVYRNNTLVSTVIKGQGVVRGDKLGTRYIDRAITKGTTYQYKVRTLDSSGRASDYTAAVSARAPTDTSPVPTISINNPSNADLTGYLNDYAIPEIQTWYPKISDAIGYPDYTPRNTITIFLDPAYTGLAEASFVTGQIRVNPTWLRNNPEDAGGMFVHESTHILQAYPGSQPGYITEGIADWTRDWFTRERPNHKPSATAKLTDGYSEGAYMLEYAEQRYSPGIIRKVNIAAHNGQYNDSVITQATGKTPQQLYDEAKAANF
jgi:hypothetical protein